MCIRDSALSASLTTLAHRAEATPYRYGQKLDIACLLYTSRCV
nr:hypothetical protein [Pseudomonas sp. HS-2]